MVSQRLSSAFVALGLCVASAALAEQISFDTRTAWQQWRQPKGAVEISPLGTIGLVKVRKNVDALRDAVAFGGGIRAVGSGANTAAQLIDGDRSTGWQPEASDPSESWWIEVDLGRMVKIGRAHV